MSQESTTCVIFGGTGDLARRKGKFPAPIVIGPNAIGWYEDEVEDWIESRPRVHYASDPQG